MKFIPSLDEKVILERLMDQNDQKIKTLKIMEKYYQRKNIAKPNNNNELILGRTQAEIKDTEDMMKFLLEEYEKIAI